MRIATITLNPCVDKTLSVARVIPDRKLPVDSVRRDPGGGGINVARVVHRLGGSVEALWSCGGRTGELLGNLLDEEGVPHAAQAMESETRENLIIVDESSGQQYRFGMPGPALKESERHHWAERLRSWSRAPDFAVFSGSVPPGTPLAWYGELLDAVPEETRVVVDTKRDALKQALERGVYLIKPNAHELEEIVGRELGDDEAIEKAATEIIRRGGAQVVLVSLGRGGALVTSEDGSRHFASPNVTVRSKVGAGDSMVGGLVCALAEGRGLYEAARMAVAAGAAAVMTEGTELCRQADALRLVEQVRAG